MKPTIQIVKNQEPGLWEAKLIWKGVPKGVKKHNHSILMRDKDVLKRYKKAVEDGKIYRNPRIVEGGGMYYEGDYVKPFQYVAYNGFVMGKYLDKDLKKIGY